MTRHQLLLSLSLLAPAWWLTAACGAGVVGGDCKPEACSESAAGGSAGANADATDADDVSADSTLDGPGVDAALDATSDGGGDGWAGHDAASDADASSDAGDASGGDAGDSGVTCTPLTNCAGICVDTGVDPENCGYCGHVCPSGICSAGVCVGATSGHVVLICASFAQSFQASPQTALLGNAVFLPSNNPVRILGWSEHTPGSVRVRVNQAVGWAAAAKGRTFAIATATSSADVGAKLDKSSFDVLLVYDQPNAPAGTLGAVGSAWAATLASFVAQGGVVVVSSGGGGSGEMAALVQGAGLLPVAGQSDITGSVVQNTAPADAVGLNVLSPFIALNQSCSWTTSLTPSTSTVFVVRADGDAGPGAPMVIHRIP